MLWKCCTQYASKFGKLSGGHKNGKGEFSLQFQRKAMPKNAQTTTKLNSSHTLARATAPHSSTLAWKIPWMEEPAGLQSMGSQRVGHNWVTSLLHFTLSILWHCLSLGLDENWTFSVLWPLLSFPDLPVYHIECRIFTMSSLRIWNSSSGIPSLPLALFRVMLPKAHLTSHSRMSGSRWVITPSWLYWSWRSLFTVLLCILATSS